MGGILISFSSFFTQFGPISRVYLRRLYDRAGSLKPGHSTQNIRKGYPWEQESVRDSGEEGAQDSGLGVVGVDGAYSQVVCAGL